VDARLVLLPGDGIGPEVVAEAKKVLESVAAARGHRFSFEEHLVGGAAIDAQGDPLPESSLAACRRADAVLLGAVGGPRWDDPASATRPEAGLLSLRKELGLYANLRPIRAHEQLISGSPLRPEILHGVDILFFRELTGGIYFGAQTLSDDGRTATSEMRYTEDEVRRIVRLAAAAAGERRGKLTSVDKANVLEVSRLWRRVAAETVAAEFPDIDYEVVLVDAMAMHLISRPADFDVIVTGNMFGDILTDEASMLPGSMGLLPSAALGDEGPGLYEPIHGSAPDLVGKSAANPLASILSAAMALRMSLHLPGAADAVERAVDDVLDAGLRTPDIAAGGPEITTSQMGDAVAEALARGR
jgi:3-isopropylmalate dehydrogenase